MKIVFEHTESGRKIIKDAHTLEAAGMFLDIRGGGMNERQTAFAMEDQRAVMDGEPITVNGIYIYTEE